MSNLRNMFISHIHEDDDGLKKLATLLSSHGMEVRDSSIHIGKFNDAKNPDYIKTEILAPAIRWAGALIVYVSRDTKSSPWVNWEIDYAAKQGKRIIGIWAYGERDCELPTSLQEHADGLAGWRGDSIIQAINGSHIWEKPDGATYPDIPLKRHPC